MRRPVKPFVTEYKGNVRRSPTPSLKLEDDAPPPRQVEQSRFGAAPPGEESYEAAMRAADALFSGQTHQHLHGEAPAGDDSEPPSASLAKGGRILRAIDEAPAQDFTALEAEHAPKRRGRKPGSKNKPKIVQAPPSAVSSPHPISSPIVALTSFSDHAIHDHAIHDHAILDHAIHANQNDAMVADTMSRPVAVATGARRGARYAWVRTQLKPGQSWKRHLPKVIW